MKAERSQGVATFFALGGYLFTVKEDELKQKLPINRYTAAFVKARPHLPRALGVASIAAGFYRAIN